MSDTVPTETCRVVKVAVLRLLEDKDSSCCWGKAWRPRYWCAWQKSGLQASGGQIGPQFTETAAPSEAFCDQSTIDDRSSAASSLATIGSSLAY